MEAVYNLSPTCNLSEDELEAVNSSNAEFAMWDPYKDKVLPAKVMLRTEEYELTILNKNFYE